MAVESSAGAADEPNGASLPSNTSPETAEATKPSLFGQHAVSQLTSQEQRDLLDAIDKLRRANIADPDFAIPQIVVCGDQSSGKSSVLEAIAQVRFPVGSGTTTKLATEVVLRNTSSTSTAPIKLTIHPAPGRVREPDKKTKIENESFPVNVHDPESFADAIRAAGLFLERLDPGCKFWDDQLHIQISGPSQPNLTLVDLPGLIQTEGENANEGDKDRIKRMVTKYISQPKTIVLAVITALNDIDNQEIIQLVKEDVHAGDRTICVLTKPDRLKPGSDDEKTAILLARNKKISLGLGWHALKNLPHEAVGRSYSQRDADERAFFSSGDWDQLDRKHVGISALRTRLGEYLMEYITQDLPAFVTRMQTKLRHFETLSDELGRGRQSADSQKSYLFRIQGRLERLIAAGSEGDHKQKDFESFFDGSSQRSLRATLNRLGNDFARQMRDQGKQYMIYGIDDEKDDELDSFQPNVDFLDFYNIDKAALLESGPTNISLEIYCRELADYMDETRGTSLPGLLASNTITAIFRQQSAMWESIAKDYVQNCYIAALDFLRAAVLYVAHPHTSQILMSELLNESFESIIEFLDQRLKELLWPYQESHPATLNPKYAAAIDAASLQQNKDEDDDTSTTKSWAEKARRSGFDHDLVFAAAAIDRTDAYYELALDNLIDNVATLGIEAVLVKQLKHIFSHEHVDELKGERLAEIAAEPPGAQQQREQVRGQIAVLSAVVRTCKKYAQKNSPFVHIKHTLQQSNGVSESTTKPSPHNPAAEKPVPPSPKAPKATGSPLFANAPSTEKLSSDLGGASFFPPANTKSFSNNQGSGLFSSSKNASAGFGGTSNTSASSGGGFFGNKPANATTSSAGTGLFGSNPSTTGFGGSTHASSGCGFGQPPKPNSTSNLFGGSTTASNKSTGTSSKT